MTNTIYPHAIVRDEDDSSSFSSEAISEAQEINTPPRRNFFSRFGKVYTAFTRSVNDVASSSATEVNTALTRSVNDVASSSATEVNPAFTRILNHIASSSANTAFTRSEVKKEVNKHNMLLNDEWDKIWKLNNHGPKNLSNFVDAELIAAGWPSWLVSVAAPAITGWIPRSPDTFEKFDKIGQGTYSIVYKARDLLTGKLVALKKVRVDILETESVQFMAREIIILRRLDHMNVVKLEGVVTSGMSRTLYLVFEYMEHDLAGLAAIPGIKFTKTQVKCYMQQILSGLEHCHNRGVLHRNIKGLDLLLDNEGMLKIADFGLASFFDPNNKQPMTSRVVTLWYRPPELLLGATLYGVGVDLWSAGCVLAELLAGKPIMPGRTEVDQLHKIYKLCGSPTDDYWKESKLPHATIFKPQQPYKRCIAETFQDFPPSSLQLIEILLAIDPAERLTATAALNSEFFTTKPYACEPSSLPHYPPTRVSTAVRGIPAPDKTELQTSRYRR